jgi:hypothetical protein
MAASLQKSIPVSLVSTELKAFRFLSKSPLMVKSCDIYYEFNLRKKCNVNIT